MIVSLAAVLVHAPALALPCAAWFHALFWPLRREQLEFPGVAPRSLDDVVLVLAPNMLAAPRNGGGNLYRRFLSS